MNKSILWRRLFRCSSVGWNTSASECAPTNFPGAGLGLWRLQSLSARSRFLQGTAQALLAPPDNSNRSQIGEGEDRTHSAEARDSLVTPEVSESMPKTDPYGVSVDANWGRSSLRMIAALCRLLTYALYSSEFLRTRPCETASILAIDLRSSLIRTRSCYRARRSSACRIRSQVRSSACYYPFTFEMVPPVHNGSRRAGMRWAVGSQGNVRPVILGNRMGDQSLGRLER